MFLLRLKRVRVSLARFFLRQFAALPAYADLIAARNPPQRSNSLSECPCENYKGFGLCFPWLVPVVRALGAAVSCTTLARTGSGPCRSQGKRKAKLLLI